MTDAELRALVRDAVARRLGTHGIHHGGHDRAPEPPAAAVHRAGDTRAESWHGHVSHHLYVNLVNSDDACVIEPSVRCDHCGYCKSHGH